MSPTRWLGRTVLAFVTGLLLLAATVAVVFLDFSPGWSRKPALIELAPYRDGMSLREAYETFPDSSTKRARLTLHIENTASWIERWRLLSEAEDRIDVSYFILENDIYGTSFLGHLLHKARSGVRVRILLDAIGTAMAREIDGNDLLDALADHERITVKIYRPLLNRFLTALLQLSPAALVASEHDKIIVADETTSMTGGRNIATEYFAAPAADNRAFLDADVRIDDEGMARRLREIFESALSDPQTHTIDADRIDLADRSEQLLASYRAMDTWLSGDPLDEHLRASLDPERLEELESASVLRGALREKPRQGILADARVLDSRVRLTDPNDVITEAIQRLVRSARRRIVVVTPYLVLSERAVSLLGEASRRGVRITIVTNSPVSSDNALSQAFFLEQWPRILAEAPTLALFVRTDGHNVHAKMATFDDQLALVGTYNLDPLSMAVNSELIVAAWSPRLAERINGFVEQLRESKPAVVRQYRIERTDDGAPQLGDDGEPKVAFGPRDHSSPEQWMKVDLYWKLLRAADELPGFDPVF